jgi:uncharacterized protein (DUF2236 family)
MTSACIHTAARIRADLPGCGSVTWRINAERLVLFGWSRAILLQFAHPLIAAGVDEHSSFRQSRVAPLRRLHGTIRAMLGMTFGTAHDAERAAAGINRIHDRVTGTLKVTVGGYPLGTPYSAHDPDLLTWVQLTLMDSLPLAFETFIGPLSVPEKDRWCAEAQLGAHLLGVPPDGLPRTFEAVQRAIADRLSSGEIVVGDTARTLASRILHPPILRLAWPWSRVNRLATVGLLPPIIRDQYGFTWTTSDAKALRRWSRMSRAVVPRMPSALRHWRAARRPPAV